jgi:hypothetical protein
MNDKDTALSVVAVDPLVMRHRQRDYLEAIKPFVSAKTEIYSVTMPMMIIHPDGQVEHQYNFTHEQKEVLRLADEAIEHMKVLIFGA